MAKPRKKLPVNLVPIVTVSPLPIYKVISGGQTGADRAGLEAALAVKLRTGGWAPKGYRTENGSDPDLRVIYKLKEHESRDYPPRTAANVIHADLTILVSTSETLGVGSRLTEKLCRQHWKPSILYTKLSKADAIQAAETMHRSLPYLVQNTSGRESYKEAQARGGWIINVAGPRESSRPGVQKKAAAFLRTFFRHFNSLSAPPKQRLPPELAAIVGE